MMDKFRKDSLMVDTPSIQGTKQESFHAWPHNVELVLPSITKFQRPNLPRTGTVSRLNDKSFDIMSPNVEFEGSVYSNQRKDLSRFKKKQDTLIDYNIAKRNMINWVQPELILTRTLMSLSRLFHAEESHAFNQIHNFAQSVRKYGRDVVISTVQLEDIDRDHGQEDEEQNSLNGSHLDVVSSDSTPLRDSMVLSRLNNAGINHVLPFQSGQYLRATTDTFSHRLSGDMRRSLLSSHSQQIALETPLFRRVDKKRAIKLYFCLDMVLKRYLKRITYRIREYRDQKAVEQFNFQVSVFNKFTQTYKHHFVPNNIATQTESRPSKKSIAAGLHILAHISSTRSELMTRGALAAVKLYASNMRCSQIESETNHFQSKITRQQEWETINTGYKKDAERKFFFCFLQNFFERNEEAMLMEAFAKIEESQFENRLRAMAVKNIIYFISRSVNKQFTKFVHLALQDKPKLLFEHGERIKGLSMVDDYLNRKNTRLILDALAEFKLLPAKMKSRRSIIGMGRPSIPMNFRLNSSEKHSEGLSILDYITKRTFNNAFRSFKVFYRYHTPFLIKRADAFGGAIHNFMASQRRRIFQMVKKFDEFKQKKIEHAQKTVSKLETIFTKQNEVCMINQEHTKHVKLGCIYMSKILECIVTRTVKNTFFELKLDQLGLSVVLSGIGLKVFGATSQAQLMAADKLSINLDKQNQSTGTAGVLNTSGIENKDEENDEYPKKGRDRGASLHIDLSGSGDPVLTKNQSARQADGSKPPLPHRSRFSLKPPTAPTNQLSARESVFLKESPILKTTDDKKAATASKEEMVTRTPRPTKSAVKVTQMGPLKGATPSARISSTPVGNTTSFSALVAAQPPKGRGSIMEPTAAAAKPKK